jgi:hypothetical protein
MTELLVLHKLFKGHVCQIANVIAEQHVGGPFCWQPAALDSPYKAIEAFLTRKFESKFMFYPMWITVLANIRI